jgi:hypothetical protein
MAVTGITDAMMQYGRATEAVFMHKPKNGKPYGIKRPDSGNIVAVLTGIFLVLVIISAIM